MRVKDFLHQHILAVRLLELPLKSSQTRHDIVVIEVNKQEGSAGHYLGVLLERYFFQCKISAGDASQLAADSCRFSRKALCYACTTHGLYTLYLRAGVTEREH